MLITLAMRRCSSMLGIRTALATWSHCLSEDDFLRTTNIRSKVCSTAQEGIKAVCGPALPAIALAEGYERHVSTVSPGCENSRNGKPSTAKTHRR
eukprot:2793194-Amphidinium_carterae.2